MPDPVPVPTTTETTKSKEKTTTAAAPEQPQVQVNAQTAKVPISAKKAVSEPPIDRDPAKLDPDFRTRLEKTLEILKGEGIPFKFNEGFRTIERQQWLYGQGREGVPYARPGKKVTDKNGTTNMSNHQGNGKPGSGCAADCYPLVNGKVVIEAPENVWKRYAEVAESQGLTAGYRWQKPHDPPHIELRKK
jgi:D-alanyl-D-alanine carboxypeptidase